LIARHRDPYERAPAPPPPERHIDASQPGEMVQMDCFLIGRLSGSNGAVWQYTAIDVGLRVHLGRAAHLRAQPQTPSLRSNPASPRGPELALDGWKLGTVTTDNGSVFVNHDFGKPIHAVGARQQRIKAARLTSNGSVEGVQLTILEACWRPSFACSLVPKLTALRRTSTNTSPTTTPPRAHTGRHVQGRVPAKLVYGARKMGAAR
jgi:hypothetical protein